MILLRLVRDLLWRVIGLSQDGGGRPYCSKLVLAIAERSILSVGSNALSPTNIGNVRDFAPRIA